MLPNRHREALEQALAALTAAVEDLGLTATLSGPLKLSVSGETPSPEETDVPVSALLGLVRPLSQDVTITCWNGGLWWSWMWNGPGRGEYESEPIAPVEEIGEVARRLHQVVALKTPI